MVTALFSLPPIGVGTAQIESLTSYLARLAEAHSVTVGTLVGEVIAEELRKVYLLRSSKHGGSRFYEQASGLNGSGKQATDLSSALFRLTGCDVSSLTLQSWRDILPAIKLLRNKKAWCPICLENWRDNHQTIYEPLIWYFKLSNVCNLHNIVLNTRCPLCESEIPVLSRKSRNGYCFLLWLLAWLTKGLYSKDWIFEFFMGPFCRIQYRWFINKHTLFTVKLLWRIHKKSNWDNRRN